MPFVSRRRVLHSGLGVLASCILPSTLWATPRFAKADLIVSGGTIHTMDSGLGAVEAIAIAGDRILAVGSRADLEALATANTQWIDARGMTVTPGFIDAHSHPLLANEAISANVNLRSIVEVQDALRRQAANTIPGHWVMGTMYDDTKFVEGRPVNRLDLDAVSTEHPIYVAHRGGHTAVVNSRAFDVAGITLDTPDPKGGKYYRENGEFTGQLAETALDQFRSAGTWPVVDRATRQENVRLITKRMAAAGLTSTTDAYGTHQDWIAYLDSRHADEMSCRLSFMPGGSLFPGESVNVYQALKDAGIRSGYGDSMLSVGAVKFSADGSASERTMRMSTPFNGRPDDYGILTMTQEEIDAAVDDAVANGYRIGIHANGDVTIDMVLKSYERVLADWQGPNPRFRIEHCSLVNENLLRRIKMTGSIPTPFYTYAHYHGEKWHHYGREKMNHMFAHRSFLDHGIPVAPASDYTPGPFEPMMALQSMVTRKDPAGRVWGPDQKITIREALQVCTMNGAYASMEERVKGSLTPGKLADIVLLDQDPLKTNPDALKDIPIRRTILGGKTVFEA